MFQAWRNLYSKSDNAKAYSLLSPALFLIILVTVSYTHLRAHET